MLASVVLFFLVALMYSIVGFGGGSSYIALAALLIAPAEFTLIPKIGLVCNLIVVSGGCVLYYRRGHFSRRLIFPFVISSVPMAFLGGLYPIKEKAYMLLLAATLIGAAARVLLIQSADLPDVRRPHIGIAVALGAALGFLSGLVGIGGGIFLSPVLLGMRWGRPKEVAATASAFIWLNSVAGLAGQVMKDASELGEVFNYWPLFIAVLVGGQIGSRVGTAPEISERLVRVTTGVLILFIGSQLLIRNII